MTALTPDPIDGERLLADLAAGNQEAVERAYRRVFDGQLGRLVLVHILAESGITTPRPAETDGQTRAHADGEVSCALRIARNAGFGDFSVALALTTGRMQGQDHERRDHDDGTDDRRDEFGGPDPDAGGI